jgi:hypothetical protein
MVFIYLFLVSALLPHFCQYFGLRTAENCGAVPHFGRYYVTELRARKLSALVAHKFACAVAQLAGLFRSYVRRPTRDQCEGLIA